MTADPQTQSHRLIQIAELLHASIKGPGTAMKTLQEAGSDAAYTQPSDALSYITQLISSQACDGADYIDINIDALAKDTPRIMRHYVRLVQSHGNGVPPCVDSSSPDVLMAGLDEWFRLGPSLRAPLVNSIPYHDKDKYAALLRLRAQKPFSIVCLLSGPEGTLKSPDEIHHAAGDMLRTARDNGFQPDEVFFDSVVLGIAADGCMDPSGELKPSHTHNSFLGLRKIKSDPALKGTRTVLGVSNWAYGTKKRRIGHIRAYVAVAQKYGLDAAIVDVSKKFGVEEAAPELMEFVETFVSLDGSDDSMMRYSTAMQQAREQEWI